MSQNLHHPHVLDTVEADAATKVAHRYQRAEGVPTAPLLIDSEGRITSPKLPELQAHVDDLEERVTDAEAKVAEARANAEGKRQEVSRLQSRINSGDAGAAARHSSASAELTALERTAHNLEIAVTSLKGQLKAASQELQLHENLSGELDLITAAAREQELAEAKAQIRAIVEPLIRRHRASDNAFYSFAEWVRQLSMPGNTSTAFGGHAMLDGDGRSYNALSFSGASVDRSGAHHVDRLMVDLVADIKADLAEEIRAQRAQQEGR